MKKKEDGHRHELIKRGIPWPEWAGFVVGVGDGYEAFEDEGDFEKFLKKFREDQKNQPQPENKVEVRQVQQRKIGFGD